MKVEPIGIIHAPLGLSIVKFLKSKWKILFIEGIGVLEGAPLLDIKPYVSDFHPKERLDIGWLQRKLK